MYDPLNLKTVNTITSNSAEDIFIALHLNYVGDRLVVGSTDKSVSIYSTSTAKQLSCFVGHGEKINAVAFTNSKEKCVSGSDDRQIKFWDI
jgi:WD40 repeat protein